MTLDDLTNYLSNLSSTINNKKMDYLLISGKYAEALLKTRIFGLGKNSTETAIGKYKDKKWATKRFNAGKQIAYVDLNFTGGLMNSIQVAEDKNDVAIYINDDKKYLISQGQEELQGNKIGKKKMKIFELSQKEQEAVAKYTEEIIDDIIQKL